MTDSVSLDAAALSLLNAHVGRNALFDAIVMEIANNHLGKGILVAMVLVGLWSVRGPLRERLRAGVLAAIVVSVAAIFAGRVLANLLPFSPRPIHTPGAQVNLARGVTPGTLDGWSSLPSDHAVMFFAIAVSVLLVSRWVGIALLAHAVVVVCLPRIYLGFHWPSDILAGAALGTALALLLQPPLLRAILRRGIVPAMERHAALAYPVLFFALLEIGVMFEPLRGLLSKMGHLVAYYATAAA